MGAASLLAIVLSESKDAAKIDEAETLTREDVKILGESVGADHPARSCPSRMHLSA